MTRDELQKLRDLPITEGLLKRLGITLSRGRFLCPAHADHTPSASVSRKTGRWKCWSCGAGGNAIDLAMLVLNRNFKDATEFLANQENIILTEYQPKVEVSARDGPTFDPSRYLRFFERPWLTSEARRFLFDERRLDPQVISWCRLTSWRDRYGTNWLQIPYYDVEGRLIGVQNRNLEKGSLPRFRFATGSHPTIYGLPILRFLKPGSECWIAEGPSDVWAHLSDHHLALGIASATLLQPRDKALLQEVTTRLTIRWRMAPDADPPGRALAAQLQNILPMLEIVPLPEGVKDYSDFRLMQLH